MKVKPTLTKNPVKSGIKSIASNVSGAVSDAASVVSDAASSVASPMHKATSSVTSPMRKAAENVVSKPMRKVTGGLSKGFVSKKKSSVDGGGDDASSGIEASGHYAAAAGGGEGGESGLSQSEEEAAMLRMESAKAGGWLVKVHIIEVRDLRPMDLNGSTDPVIRVEVWFGHHKRTATTRIVTNDRNAVFDEDFLLEFDKVTLHDIETARVLITVMDSDTLSRTRNAARRGGDVIGTWEIDLLEGVYSRPSHEFYRQFVAIYNYEAQKKDERGVQGFVKLSVTAVGPDDKLPYHNIVEERQLERKAHDEFIHLPRHETELRFLVIKLHTIFDVPFYKNEYAKRLFIRAHVGSTNLATHPVGTVDERGNRGSALTTRTAEVEQTMWITIIYPKMSQSVWLSVWEERSGFSATKDQQRLLGRLDSGKLNDIRSAFEVEPDRFKHVTAHFYGAPLLSHKYLKGGKTEKEISQSTFHGQVLFSLLDLPAKKRDGTMRPQKNLVVKEKEKRKGGGGGGGFLGLRGGGGRKGQRLLKRNAPEERESDDDESDVDENEKVRGLTLKARVLVGANLPFEASGGAPPSSSSPFPSSSSSRSASQSHKYAIRISCGKYYVETNLQRPDPTLPGSCDWTNSGVRTVTFPDFTRSAAVAADEERLVCPDVIMTLMRSSGTSSSDVVLPICYRRLPASDVFKSTRTAPGMEPKAEWIHLKEDKAIDALHDTVFPGSVLVKVGLYRTFVDDDGKGEGYGSSLFVAASSSCPRWIDESSTSTSSSSSSATSARSAFPDRRPTTVPYIVKINIYTGRDLPPSDQKTGALDPYLVCSLGGTVKSTTIKHDNRNPSWFETLTFHVRLPPKRRMDLWPEVVLQLWDEDIGCDDDFVGNLIVKLTDHVVGGMEGEGDDVEEEEERKPRWYDLFYQEPGDIEQGSVLLSVDIVEDTHGDGNQGQMVVAAHRPPHLPHPPHHPPSLPLSVGLPSPSSVASVASAAYSTSARNQRRRGNVTTETFLPHGEERTVEVLALGCRDLLSPSKYAGLRRPFVKFQIADSKSVSTPSSSRPSSRNCNFGVRLKIDDVFLPDDPELAPFLQVKVLDNSTMASFNKIKKSVGVDRQSGGADAGKRMIGTGSLSLKSTHYYSKDRTIDSQPLGTKVAETTAAANSSSGDGSTRMGTTTSAAAVNTPAPVTERKQIRQKAYMTNRPFLHGEMQVEPVYNIVEIYRGKRDDECETSKYDLTVVGRLHVFMRVLDPHDGLQDTSMWDLLMNQLTKPTRYDVRVYILGSTSVAARDSDGKSDPYVRLRIGEGRGFGRDGGWVKSEVKKDTLRPRFFQRFDLSCKIPGESSLHIEMMDKDTIGTDDLIGKTTIELDERVHSKEWQAYGTRKPIERRNLMMDSSRLPQGTLSMWVDVIEHRNKKFPVWDIAQAPEEEFECRVVVWKVEGVPPGDPFTDQSDLFVKLKLGHGRWRSTDTHMFAKNGKGSFNYRFKFPVRLGDGGKVRGEGTAKLKIQVWDADLLFNDVLVVTHVNLAHAFENAWAMKDVGLGYQHFGDVDEQLQTAARVKAARESAEKDEEDKEKQLKDIPINWRDDPVGFIEGKAEQYDNAMGVWGALIKDELGEQLDQLKALDPMNVFKSAKATAANGAGSGGGGKEEGERQGWLQGWGLGGNKSPKKEEEVADASSKERGSLLERSDASEVSDVETGDAGGLQSVNVEASDFGFETSMGLTTSETSTWSSPKEKSRRKDAVVLNRTGGGLRGGLLQRLGTSARNNNNLTQKIEEASEEEEPLLKVQSDGDIETGDGDDGLPEYQSMLDVEVAAEEHGTDSSSSAEETLDTKQQEREENKKKKEKKLMLENQFKETMGMAPPENSKWVPFKHVDLQTGEVVDSGAKILLSIELLPKDVAEKRCCGEGRDEPNAHPFLPPPEGRANLLRMMYNPIYAIRVCLGDNLAAKCGMVSCCVLIIAAMLVAGVFLGPYIEIGVGIMNLLPPVIARWIALVIALSALAGGAYCYFFGCWCCKKNDDDEEEDIDMYDEDDESDEDEDF